MGIVLTINTEKLGKTYKTTFYGHWAMGSRGEWGWWGSSGDKIAFSLALCS